MTLLPYTYVILRYVHDRGAGEALNVGVLMWSHEADFIGSEFNHRYERFSQTFRGFNGEHYRYALTRVRSTLMHIQKLRKEHPLLDEKPQDVRDVLQQLWTDKDTSLQWAEPRSGVASDLHEELKVLFDRMVVSQYPAGDEISRRDDEDLWRQVYQRKIPERVARELRPKRFVTSHVEVEFDRAIKNGRWHVVQPVSMDFKNVDTMQKKATQWVGTAVGLQDASDLARIYFLLGRPSQKRHFKAYDRAKKLLDRAPVPHELIEENDVARLVDSLQSIIEPDEE